MVTKDGKMAKKYCAHVSFLPDMVNDSVKGSNVIEQVKLEPKVKRDFLDQKGEFIFLVDRSGSMEGKRMEKAREALVYFLKSLPEGSFFDILSFGAQYHSHAQSHQFGHRYNNTTTLPATEKSINEACEVVSQMKADMGGTKILEPLGAALLRTTPRPNVPRYVFLLTDGDVNNTQAIVNLILNNQNRATVSTFGIGSGASEELVKKVALAGRGMYEFASDAEDVAQKVVTMLEKVMIPVIDDIKVNIDKTLVEMATPNPDMSRFVTTGQCYNSFIFLNDEFEKKGATQVTFSFKDPVSGKPVNISKEIILKDAFPNEFIPKLGAFQAIRQLEDSLTTVNATGPKAELDVFFAITSDLSRQILDLSIDHQVLCGETSLLLVSNEKVNTKGGPISFCEVPNLHSIDHYHTVKQPEAGMKVMFRKQQSHSSRPVTAATAAQLSSKLTAMERAYDKSISTASLASIKCDSVSKEKDYKMPESKTASNARPMTAKAATAMKPVPAPAKAESSQKRTSTTSISAAQSMNCAPKSSIKANSESMEVEATPQIDNLTKVISKAKMEGSWIFDKNILQTELKCTPEVLELIRKAVEDLKLSDDMIMTLIVLVWMEKHHSEVKAKWSLIARKAERWLKSQDVDSAAVQQTLTAIFA